MADIVIRVMDLCAFKGIDLESHIKAKMRYNSLREYKHGKNIKPMIEWQYFFGGSSGRSFDRFYKAEINGQRVEKHCSNTGVEYSIGNIDEAKIKFKTEEELIKAVNQ